MSEAVKGSVLVHEHVLVDFGGAASPHAYDEGEVVRAALPKLRELKAQGCARMLECTPNYLGRAPRILRRLQDEVGIELWTNTGIYGAANRVGVPYFVQRETARQLAARWIGEARRGVEGLKPRFIKTGVNGFPLEEVDRKLVEAAAMTSLETGLMIASHTNGAGRAAMAQLELLDGLKCPASKFVWVHAQSEKDHVFHERAARAGAWVELDGIGEKSAEWHRQCVMHLQGKGLLGQALISQDAGWYHAGEPGGGTLRGYTYIYTDFLPSLPAGMGKALLVENPRRAFGE
jgi:phosphotriesterase-related protein